jgi:hypothetical protein
MLKWLRKKGPQRKLQLFCCAICRQVQENMKDENSRRAVEVAERRAEGLVTEREVRAARSAAMKVYAAALSSYAGQCNVWDGPAYSACNAAGAARWVLTDSALTTARLASYVGVGEKYRPSGVERADADQFRALTREEYQKQAVLLRDVVGNPFLPVVLVSDLLMPHVVVLSQAIYDDCAFDRLPILADALEEAGCTDAVILGHLRGPGPHVRGCWVLDLLLGKE